MRTMCLIWLAAGFLALPRTALAQTAGFTLPLAPTVSLVAGGGRAMLGGPPQLATEPVDTASLHQLLLLLEQAASGPAATRDAHLELSLQATRLLAQQLAATQQQLADLRRQLAATRKLASELLLDHTELTDLRQQLHLLQSQRAAAASAARQYRVIGWPAE